MKKQEYKKPTMDVVMLNPLMQLYDGSIRTEGLGEDDELTEDVDGNMEDDAW